MKPLEHATSRLVGPPLDEIFPVGIRGLVVDYDEEQLSAPSPITSGLSAPRVCNVQRPKGRGGCKLAHQHPAGRRSQFTDLIQAMILTTIRLACLR